MGQILKKRQKTAISPGCPCPICSELAFEAPYSYSRDGCDVAIYYCKKCDFLYGRPVFISDENQRQMDSILDAELFESPPLRWLHRELILKREIKNVREILGDGAHRLLDIGCGTGWTTQVWKECGFDVMGLEPSASRRSMAEERYGIPVIGEFLENANIEERFNVVILRHIVEHFADPKELVKKASSLVTPGGLLLVVIPNIRCFGRYIFDTNWTWVLPWHCNFFSPHSLNRLIEQIGFRTVKTWQSPSPMYYHESFLRRFPYSPVKKALGIFGSVGMLFFSPMALAGLIAGLGDNLSVIATAKLLSE